MARSRRAIRIAHRRKRACVAEAFVPRRVVVGRSSPIDTTLEEMQAATDFGDRVWIDAPMTLHEEQNGPGELTLRRIRYGYRLQVAMQKSGWVVVSETTWKGWCAYLDGHRVQMQIA